ncbi:MAG: four helix bundle protein [Terriglobales bacterium]
MPVMTPQQVLRERSKKFALDALVLTDQLPNNSKGWVLGKQLLRSATSVAANYRAAGRARSRAEFVAKLGVVVEETDESVFWLELIESAGLLTKDRVDSVLREANELLRIFSASYRTAQARVDEARSPDHPITGSPD